MIHTTLKDALEGHLDTTGHYVYLYRDGDVVFYIGMSSSPLDRLQEHIGRGQRQIGKSLLGQTIADNMPEALTWQVEFFTLADCEPLMLQHSPGTYLWFKTALEQFQADTDCFPESAVRAAEDMLIRLHRPCLNTLGNRQGLRLPERYVKPEIIIM